MNEDDHLAALRVRAQRGNTAYQIQMGQALLVGKTLYGVSVVVDYDEARYWLERAHEQGASTATFILGTIYEEGLGLVADVSKAIVHYESSAARGSHYAKLRLARIYANEHNECHSIDLAKKWYGEVLGDTDVDDEDGMEEARRFLSAQD